MSRIPTPATIEDAPALSQPMLNEVMKSYGIVPNLYRLASNSPAVLEGYISLSGALTKGDLDPATRERIAIAIANINGCTYCNSAHSYIGKRVAKLSDDELAANRVGTSTDPNVDAALKFAAKIVRDHGHISEDDLRQVRLAGYTDGQLLEIVAHVALNTFTNYVNEAFKTEVDFPLIEAIRAT